MGRALHEAASYVKACPFPYRNSDLTQLQIPFLLLWAVLGFAVSKADAVFDGPGRGPASEVEQGNDCSVPFGSCVADSGPGSGELHNSVLVTAELTTGPLVTG